MMSAFSLSHVRHAQFVLETAGVKSAVTGDVGLSYHGVDIAIFVGSPRRHCTVCLLKHCVDCRDLYRGLRPLSRHRSARGTGCRL
jgi:hypothetical protein